MDQAHLRTDLYQNVVDQIRASDVSGEDIGRQIILPATHIGSPRDMHSRLVEDHINQWCRSHLH